MSGWKFLVPTEKQRQPQGFANNKPSGGGEGGILLISVVLEINPFQVVFQVAESEGLGVVFDLRIQG